MSFSLVLGLVLVFHHFSFLSVVLAKRSFDDPHVESSKNHVRYSSLIHCPPHGLVRFPLSLSPASSRVLSLTHTNSLACVFVFCLQNNNKKERKRKARNDHSSVESIAVQACRSRLVRQGEGRAGLCGNRGPFVQLLRMKTSKQGQRACFFGFKQLRKIDPKGKRPKRAVSARTRFISMDDQREQLEASVVAGSRDSSLSGSRASSPLLPDRPEKLLLCKGPTMRWGF